LLLLLLLLAGCRWTGIYTYKKDTGALVKNCIKLRSSETSPQRIAQLFGECGVAPKHFANLPTSVCQEDAGGAVYTAAVVTASLCESMGRIAGTASGCSERPGGVGARTAFLQLVAVSSCSCISSGAAVC
jgi:hypothetical protein